MKEGATATPMQYTLTLNIDGDSRTILGGTLEDGDDKYKFNCVTYEEVIHRTYGYLEGRGYVVQGYDTHNRTYVAQTNGRPPRDVPSMCVFNVLAPPEEEPTGRFYPGRAVIPLNTSFTDVWQRFQTLSVEDQEDLLNRLQNETELRALKRIALDRLSDSQIEALRTLGLD